MTQPKKKPGGRKHRSYAEGVLSATSDLISILDPDEVLKCLPAVVEKHFRFSGVTLYSVDRTSNKLVPIHGSAKRRKPYTESHNLGDASSLVGWSAMNEKAVRVNGTGTRPPQFHFIFPESKSAVAIPITSNGGVEAVLSIEEQTDSAFGEAEYSALRLLCQHASAILANAKLYQRMKQTVARLDELDRLKSEFVGIVSHDFRSPLSSILLAARGLLKNEELTKTKQVRDHLNIIVDQALRLSHLAEDTLSITELESGKLNYSFKILNVERLIEDAIAMVKPSARHKVTYSIHPEVSYVKGDQNKLRQVVTNLISNAVKYSPRGGKVTIDVKEQNPKEVLFAVTDEGVGIPDEHMAKLFRKFSRLEHQDSKQIRGAGLGLWISKEIVTAHGGRIWCESEIGRGSTFNFTVRKVPG